MFKIANQSNKQTKSLCLKTMRYPLIDQLNATFSSTSVDPQNPQRSCQFVDPHFSQCVPTQWCDSLFYLFGENLIFRKRFRVATYFVFILKGK